jgi:pimeloyl-ACP methyl ester carboxylesterase
VTSSYLYLNGLRVHYLRWDADGPGPPVLLLHGLGSNARIWERVAPHLAARGLQPLAPDLRGHGLTDRPDGDYGFEAFYRDLAAFITASELERPVLVGHSWGALLALDYAARRSFGPLAPAAILLVEGGMTQLDDGPGGTWEEVRDRLAPPHRDGIPLENFLAGLSPGWRPDDQAVQIYLSNFDISADETLSPRLTYERHLQVLRAMWEYKTYERFDRVKCPVLLVPARWSLIRLTRANRSRAKNSESSRPAAASPT